MGEQVLSPLIGKEEIDLQLQGSLLCHRFLPLGGVVHTLVVFVIELVIVSSSGVSLMVIPPAME